MIAFILLIIITSSGQVLYHFGTSYGQIFRDRIYSSSRVAVSGSSSSIDSFDTIPTDRGAYIPHHSAGIRIYPNDITSDYTLINSEFTAAIWYMMVPGSDGIIFTRSMNQGGYIYADHYGGGDFFYISYCNGYCTGQSTANLYKSKRNFYLAVWVLFGIRFNYNNIEIYIDDSLFFTLWIGSPLVETSVERLSIGSAGSWYGTVGFIWYYHHQYIVASLSSFIQLSSSLSCFYSGCLTCSPSIVDPVLQMTGCTSYDTNPYSSSNGYCTDFSCT